MKIRGTLNVTKDIIAPITGNSVSRDGKYGITDDNGVLRWGDLAVPIVDTAETYGVNSLVLDNNGNAYISLVNNASGTALTDPAVWKEFGSAGSGGGDTTKNITASVDVGGIAIGDLVPIGTDLTEFVEQIISPLILPTIATMNSVALNGINSATLEVGETFISTLSTVYNRGSIESKNGAPDVSLTGPSTGSVFSGAGVDTSGDINTTIVEGTNRWSVVESFSVGTEPYYDSSGNLATNLDSQREPGTVTDTSNAIIGRYSYWWSVGSIPTDGTIVRGLSNKGFVPITSFDIMIPAYETLVAFYLPSIYNSVKVLYVESSNADVTDTIAPVDMSINDAGGVPQQYIRFEAVIKGIGYDSDATYRVIIL